MSVKRATILIALTTVLPCVAPVATTAAQKPDSVRVVEVKMIDKSTTEFAFNPSEVTVRVGDVVRFIQTGTMPHNVEFNESAEVATLEEVRIGPYLTQVGQTYEIEIDGRFSPGRYPFVCTPHQFLGMKGVLTVTDQASRSPVPPEEVR
ncbi:MAG: plastocyanin/azurin family copper-binding protein [Longimicrobiales bacterium]|nr:plastocyanin/azurin family copper-binding protein [Longimicrobiales bacterium]